MQSESKSASASVPLTATPHIQPKISETHSGTPKTKALESPADSPDSQSDVAGTSTKEAEKIRGKQGAQPKDEIDALFDTTLGKKVKRAELASVAKEKPDGVTRGGHAADGGKDLEREKRRKSKKRKEREGSDNAVDRDLKDVLGAIRAAPKAEKGPMKRKRGQ